MTLPSAAYPDNFTELYEFEPTLFGDVIENNNINDTYVDVFLDDLALTLNIYYTPVLIILGCIGNIISVVVFYKSKLRVQSTSQYLTALAISDSLFLCLLLPPWLKAVGISTIFSQNGYCQVFMYMSYVTSNHSSWLVVAFTVERLVAVVYPLRRNSVCTVRRARYVIATLAVAAMVINLPMLRFAVSSANECNIDKLLMEPAARFNMVDTVVSFTLPLTLIVVLNSWIMAGVCRVSRGGGPFMRLQWQCRHAVAAGRPPRFNKCQRSQQRVTRMLLIVSSVFVVLNLPAYTMRIIAYTYNMGEHEYSGRWAAVQQICLIFFNTNFGINFVLYCMTGQNFRRALLDTFPWLSERRRRLARVARRATSEQPVPSVSTSFAHSFSYNQSEVTVTASTGGNTGRPGQSGDGARREAAAVLKHKRRHSDQVIKRWRFDNARLQQRRESFAMQPMSSVASGTAAGQPPGKI